LGDHLPYVSEGLLRGGLRLTIEGGLLPHGEQLSNMPQRVGVERTPVTTHELESVLDVDRALFVVYWDDSHPGVLRDV